MNLMTSVALCLVRRISYLSDRMTNGFMSKEVDFEQFEKAVSVIQRKISIGENRLLKVCCTKSIALYFGWSKWYTCCMCVHHSPECQANDDWEGGWESYRLKMIFLSKNIVTVLQESSVIHHSQTVTLEFAAWLDLYEHLHELMDNNM